MQKFTPRTVALALEYHLFKKDKALIGRWIPAKLQAMLRRRARAKYLVWDARNYNLWMQKHRQWRAKEYAAELEPGLLSLATPVWDGSPVQYLRLLAESIAVQNAAGACEWFVLDNGCTKSELRQYLDELAQRYAWVTVHREEKNEGIVGGLRVCLERARGRYLCTVDSDDLLYSDCLQIVQSWIRRGGFPALLYSDEDKVIGSHAVQPYFKPDFDPVLLLNSAYIAHLGVVERDKALELGAYTDRETEGSPDWDCFVRFYLAGYAAVHIPEVIYSWRMYPESTAEDAGSKPYIHHSQQAVIGRYLQAKGFWETNVLRYSPLLPGTADWWIERKHVNPVKVLLVSDEAVLDYPDLAHTKSASLHDLISGEYEFICFLLGGLKPERADALWEAQGLFERFPDAVMVGGWVANHLGQVQDGPLVPGFGAGCGCPDEGRAIVDPGYFTQMRKQRSVSAVSSRFAVIRTDFLRAAVAQGGITDMSLAELGPWLGEFALKTQRRIIFSPFLRANAPAEEEASQVPSVASPARDQRYYPSYFGLTPETAYQLQLRE